MRKQKEQPIYSSTVPLFSSAFDADKENVSNCCGARARGNGDTDDEDYGICSDCGDHCLYVSEEENDFSDSDFDRMREER